MLGELIGKDSLLWERAPDMALVLLSTVPSGRPAVVRARSNLLSCMLSLILPMQVPFVVPTLGHVDGKFHSYPSPLVYLGLGPSDVQKRPSQWANPFLLLSADAENSYALFSRYLLTRGDLVEFLASLSNAELICDCACEEWCHGHALIDSFSHHCRDEFAAEAIS